MTHARRIIAAVAVFLCFLCLGSALAESPRAQLVEGVEKIAEEAIASGRVVGLSIGVAKGDEVVLARGYGSADLEAGVAASRDTVYRIGSITKQFTAAAILKLVESGKLGLDDPITDHLKEYPSHDPPVTIRHLLQHTSGIQSFTSLPSYRALMRNDVTHSEMIARFKALPHHFEPGEQFRYCNSGYYLLGVIVEAASDVPYEAYLESHIFKPLNLKRTRYDRAHRVISQRARGYRRIDGEFENAAYLSMTQPYSAGALVSTVEDLIHWQRGLVSGRLLSADSYKAMTAKGALSDGKTIDYGLGLFLRKSEGRMTVGHGGGIDGFRSDLTYYPESDYTIVVLANSESARPERISRQIAKLIFTSSKGDSGAAQPAPPQNPDPTKP